MAEKPLRWVGSARNELRAFPEEARREAGYQLFRVQQGELPTDWKPISSVGPGIQEIRIHTEVEHRVVYITKFAEAVYVLHAFEKRSRRTARGDLDLARQRLAAVVQERRRR